MKKLVSPIAVAMALLIVALPLVYGQGQARPPADKTFEGQLTNVDTNTRTITVKGSAGEMAFRYTEQTEVVGGEKDVQGLAAKKGSPLKITYQDVANNHIATKIEVVEKK